MNPRMGVAAAAYRQAAASVHPTVAVVRLYDAALLAILQAIRAREAAQFEACFTAVMRAATILRGLDHALDFDKGGAVAERLHRVYRSYILSLHLSYGKSDVVRRYTRLHDSLVELRDAWAGIAGMPAYVRNTQAAEPAVHAAATPAPAAPSAEDDALMIGLSPALARPRPGVAPAVQRLPPNAYARRP